MGLKTKKLSKTENNNKLAPGLYMERTKIIGVKDKTKTGFEFLNSKPDLAIEVFFDDKGLSFIPSVAIFGNFKREGETISDWGGAFKINRFFADVINIEDDLTDDHKIPKEWLTKAKGIEVYKITYTSGLKADGSNKAKYSTWDYIFPASDEDDLEVVKRKILEVWNKQREKGYPKNFRPIDANGFHENDPAGLSEDDVFEEDNIKGGVTEEEDDLPF